MTHAERMAALVAALANVPPDERDQWGEYPAHNDAAHKLGIRTNGSSPGKICDVRLGMLGKSGPTIALAAEIVKAAKECRGLVVADIRAEVAHELGEVDYDVKARTGIAAAKAGLRLDELLTQWEEGT